MKIEPETPDDHRVTDPMQGEDIPDSQSKNPWISPPPEETLPSAQQAYMAGLDKAAEIIKRVFESSTENKLLSGIGDYLLDEVNKEKLITPSGLLPPIETAMSGNDVSDAPAFCRK